MQRSPLLWLPGTGCYSVKIGSCRIYKIIYREDIELIGLLKQDRESDFCFGKEDSDPRSEQLLCQAQRRLGSET